MNYTIVDFDNDTFDSADDYPEYLIPLAQSVASDADVDLRKFNFQRQTQKKLNVK